MTASAPRPDPVALVTGAARGIGAATVSALVAQGWRVVATDVGQDDPRVPYPLGTREELDAVAARNPERIRPAVADVTDPASLGDAVEVAVGEFGRLDAAIGCAGVLVGGDTTWTSSADCWDVQLAVNATGMWNLARVSVPAILESRRDGLHGSFVAVSSAAGTTGLPLLAAYAASKHAVVGLVRSLAAELGPHGVTANAVSPGSTRTPILDASAAVYDLDDPEEFATHHLLDRLVEPAEVASLIAYLCSDAAGAITGAVLPVDAGMTAHGG